VRISTAAVSVLMGANVASEVAKDQFCEATIGARDIETGQVWFTLLSRPTLRLNVVLDVEGVEVCGGLKGLVALGAGFCDGLQLGSNTKAALVRIGLEEMRRFGKHVFGAKDASFFESCGVGDVIASSYAPDGRHRMCAQAFVSSHKGKSWPAIEGSLLKGQSLGDLDSLKAVTAYLRRKGVAETKYPLFSKVHGIAFEEKPAIGLDEIRGRTKWRRRTNRLGGSTPVGLSVIIFMMLASVLVASVGGTKVCVRSQTRARTRTYMSAEMMGTRFSC